MTVLMARPVDAQEPPPSAPVRTTPPREESRADNAVYVELGGPALIYSVDYERRFLPVLGARVGAGVVPLCMFHGCSALVMVPASAVFLLGGGNHHVELGAGVSVALIRDDDARFVVPQVGYRYEHPLGGLIFRAMVTPLIRLTKPSDTLPWAGLSAGYSW